MIVVDTNVIGNLYLTSDRSPQAEKAFWKDPQGVAPRLWRSELRNVLAHYLRREVLSLPETHQIMDLAVNMMWGREYKITSFQVLDLVARSTCSAYECEFVALAEEIEVPLVTVDRVILEQFPVFTLHLETFVVIN